MYAIIVSNTSSMFLETKGATVRKISLALLASATLLAGCIKPPTPEQASEITNSTLTVEENWGRLWNDKPVSFRTVSSVSKLGDTGLGIVFVLRDVDSEIFSVLTTESQIKTGSRVCLTEVGFPRVAGAQDGFVSAKPC